MLYIGYSIDQTFVLITSGNHLFHSFVFVDTFFFFAGLLLREIKDFWPVALLMATLLYPADVDYAQDLLNRHFELEKRKELFDDVYNEIVKLGINPKSVQQSIMKTSCFLIQSFWPLTCLLGHVHFPVAFQVWKMCGRWNLWWMGRRLWTFCNWKQEDHLLENGWVNFQVKTKHYDSNMNSTLILRDQSIFLISKYRQTVITVEKILLTWNQRDFLILFFYILCSNRRYLHGSSHTPQEHPKNASTGFGKHIRSVLSWMNEIGSNSSISQHFFLRFCF